MFLIFEKILKIIIKLKVYNKTHFVSKKQKTVENVDITTFPTGQPKNIDI